MKISTILDHIDSGHMALPEFQRGYVWNGEQVRKLFHSLYLRRPVGGLLVWCTPSNTATHRGDGLLAQGIVKLLLDGQQRMTSIYGVVRGKPPKFFDGNEKSFTGLRFHLESQSFEFYQPVKMQGDPLWVDVSELMKKGTAGLGSFVTGFSSRPEYSARIGDYVSRLSNLLGIADIELHVEEVTGDDKTLEVVVDIFNQVNSGGTKLSKGDLALAKICADWPEARETMKKNLLEWKNAGYDFELDWLLRSVNTALTGEAKFLYLHERKAEEIKDGLERAVKHIHTVLNMIGGRLGLDHDRVLFSRFGIPVMVRYLDKQGTGKIADVERDKLLFWFVQSGMWGRFSGSTESYIDKDLEALDGEGGGLDKLLDQLRLWHGGLRVEAGHFSGWSLGARFYPVLYMLTRTRESKDWGTGLPLKANLLGKMSKLEVHHIFPKAQLYDRGLDKTEVNALANFCFLTKDTNINISDRLPEEYFPEIEKAHPGALASQWIPEDPALWKIEKYREFLEVRKELLANEVNRLMEELLHGETKWLEGPPAEIDEVISSIGGIASEAEERRLIKLNNWMEERGLPAGILAYDYIDPESGELAAVLDLAWPNGIQEELTQPVAILLDEEPDIVAMASQAGYLCFTSISDFKRYVITEILGEETDEQELDDQENGGRYITKVRAMRKSAHLEFWTMLLEKSKNRIQLFSNISPSKAFWLSAGAGISGVSFNYDIFKDSAQVELYIYHDHTTGEKNKKIFDQLYARKEQIEKDLGEPLDWQRLDTKKACRISKKILKGGIRNKDVWHQLQDEMIDAMIRFEKAIKPRLTKIEV